ncbi:phenylalanine--tRNA ligase subunit beta [Simiduia agarivorans]|uniref:Phenylalanine--tRNA ligase beta subunit n=1 Tax=Simiduia agarivorans (strain DSM 21679 / JCM 13881 / BCRC 17597 / SA1) TaxID=1117647 RepID=K4KHV9_SIMAS|nr:phenylalanine--tRNA ligase subunit beta [Simiduia agarivorans]AFU97770.1 phenylalanyl-tRNA ligase subunit beta [Simiduia agarivorans SA1 = DSM 21679]
MKISESWLREWVNPQVNTSELCEQLTMAGLEVDGIEAVAGEFTGVVVGEIVEIEQHPDADKLRVCKVAGNGDELTQVVCGAPNARVGIKVPFATVGAVLPGDFKIKKAKLRGVESFGMLCAQTELQAGDDDDGLWELPADAPAGVDLREYLKLNDKIIEVDLTPNRADCLSLAGVAREVGVLNQAAVTPVAINPVKASIDHAVSASIDTDGCGRYSCRVIKNIDLSQPTPLWMAERLRRAGLRSIDAVVDVTNYLLLELGQPMHAFDLARIDGGIQVRMAKADEQLKLLDGQEVKLNTDTLVIADNSKALAMAGIMGGDASAVSESTTDILLESAFFTPEMIAGKARSYGLHTDSSHRFERGVDPALATQAIERATELLLAIVGGEAGPVVVAERPSSLPEVARIRLRRARIEEGLGFAIEDSRVLDILNRLGLEKVAEDADGWTFQAPSHRFDMAIEADLLEELARIYGYNNLPVTSLKADLPIEPQAETQTPLSRVQQTLTARGYQEAITYSFIEPKLQTLFDPDAEAVSLLNPISSDLSVMRTSLLAGLANALVHNLNRQQTRVRLFETGLSFVKGGSGPAGLTQKPKLAALVYGTRDTESWAHAKDRVDFYDIKGDLDAILSLGGASARYSFVPAQHPALHPGQTAHIIKGGQVIGVIGALHPNTQKALDLDHPAFVFELDLEALLSGVQPKFAPLSKFPEVRRDLAVLIDREIGAKNLLEAVKSAAGDYLTNLKVFDVYSGKGIDPHRKSVALGLTYQHPSRTLNDDEINASVAAVVTALEAQFNATLR